jgi:hypothetical protein
MGQAAEEWEGSGSPSPPAPANGRGVTWRAVVLGLILIPLNCYWVIYVEGIRHWNHATAMSLFWNTIFCLTLLVLFNVLLKRLGARRLAFSQGELITVYAMITLATALAGHDSLQLGYPGLYLPFTNRDAIKSTKVDYIAYYPRHLTVQDPEVLQGVKYGGDTLYRAAYLQAWAGPVFWWCAFIGALGLVMICLNVIVRKQWTENEKLSFPIVQLPMAMTQDGGTAAFFRHRPLWLGMMLGGGLDVLNGLHFFYPAIPGLVVRHDSPELNIGQFFTQFPWTAVPRSLGMPFYPFIIAIGYFLPLDLSFSIWFFFLLKIALLVLSAALGYQPGQPHNPPFLNEQSWGAWITIFAYAGWISRRQIIAVFRTAWRLPGGEDDSREPLSYRAALAGILLGGGFLVWFCVHAGMTAWITVLFFLIFFILAVAITRVRAELGPPAHEMAGNMNAQTMLFWMYGTSGVGVQNLTVMSMFWWFTGRGYRSDPMPCQLEAFKMGEAGRVNMRGLGWVMLLAMVVGGLATFWACLALEYHYGANAMTGHNYGQYQLLRSRLEDPRGPDVRSLSAVGFGAAVTVCLVLAHIRLPWWPLHPAGYALSMNFGIEYFWTCLIISSALKWIVLRYGGHRLNRQVMPLMFGLILGEYCVGAFWSAMSVILDSRTYDFAPG